VYLLLYHFLYITYIGTKLIDVTSSNAPDNHAADILALHCTTDDQISIEKASKCSISCHYRRAIRVSKVVESQQQHIPSSGNKIVHTVF